MDNELFALIGREIPPIEEKIADGLATKVMSEVEAYVDSILKCAAQDFPEGLTYSAPRSCMPLEEYNKATEDRGGRSYFDIARNDVYMVAYTFFYKGEEITRYLYLPYVRDGGLITIRGSTFAVSPVLADKAISIGPNSVFVQIPRAKDTYERLTHHFMGNDTRQSVNVVHSRIHNRSKKSVRSAGKPIVNAVTTLPHYLFAKYGVVETFRRFCGTTVEIGTPETINETTHPHKDWVICSATGLKPKGVKGRYYQGSTIRLAIRECDYDVVTSSIIGGFFYVVDHFPERILPEYLTGDDDECWLWRVMLGQIIGGVDGGYGKIADDMNEHMDSLDSYIDPLAKENLAQGDIYVDNIYELFVYIIETLAQMTAMSTDEISTMYGKQLMVLRYILRDIVNAIFKLTFKLKKAAMRKTPTHNDIVKVMQRHFRPDVVFGIRKDHGEVNSVSSPGDNKYFKITSNMILQTDSSGSRGKSKTGKTDPSKFLHASIVEVGSYTVLPKSEPTGRTRANPWVKVDEHNLIVRDPSKQEIIDKAQQLIRRQE